MALYEHPVNTAREARGDPVVNSLWLWGAGKLPASARGPWQSVSADDPAAIGLGRLAGMRHRAPGAGAGEWLGRAPEEGRHLVVLDGLRGAQALGDLAGFARRLQALEETWFAPLLAALKAGRVGMLTLHVPEAGLSFEAARADLRHFWRRPRPLNSVFDSDMKIVTRPYAEKDRQRLVESGVHPLLARLFAARRIGSSGGAGAGFLAADSARRAHQRRPRRAPAGRCHRAAEEAAHRRRLRRRRRHRLRRRRARAAQLRRARRVPGAQPLRARLRPHARAGGHRGETRTRPADHGGQRHRQRRGRGAREPPRHRHADHRPPPARRHAARGRVHRQSEPARLRLSVEGDRRRRRDVLRDAGAARRTAGTGSVQK